MTTALGRPLAWVAPALSGAVRVVLGLLWVREGVTKYRAHFGRADILLVVDSAKQNSRVPGVFSDLLAQSLGRAPSLFGLIVPAWETLLGLALVVGILSRVLACAAIVTLMTYWLSDQLIGQYPVMVVLAATVLAFPVAASTYSASRALSPPRARSISSSSPMPEATDSASR
ncbi:hypothetical protein GCM10011492_37350 [Flexivirga endophytica]|uniref:DoxX family membrane protein n=1 Tax=Flexivirga endophytica TaxID=1849103 RepID=A0A916TFI6_9MICO|nr:DoxX family membrane protein [Flexivirga endophytica]GGB42936.1 hypothetical protein GCM10011492_37350 [Flexivirga endophytica]GHB64451.1 hypothetical protein GCM10008112_36700 [Flexivirga endophytica]